MPQFLSDMGSEGSDEDDHIAKHFTVVTLLLTELADTDHEGRDARVVGESLDVTGHLLDELVHTLQAVLRRLGVVDEPFIGAVLPEQAPELLQETEAAIDAIGVPRLAGLNRTEEHLVETERVGTVVTHNVVGVDHIIH